MNFDFGEVLSRAWQISWKHKSLWLFGIFLGLFIFAILPLVFVPALLPVLSQDSRTTFLPIFAITWIGLLMLFFLVSFPLSAIAQASITLGALHANQDKEKLSIGELIQKSLPFFSRVLGIMLLFTAGVMLVNLIVQGVSILLTIVTLGLGVFCLTPLFLLMYPALMVVSVWMEQAINAIIVDDMRVIEAAKQSWYLIRDNLASISVLALVIYVGIGMVTGIAMIPMFVSLFVLPFGFIEQKVNWAILSIALLGSAAFVTIFVVFNGWALAFMKSVWVLTYLRLTGGAKSQPALLEAAPS